LFLIGFGLDFSGELESDAVGLGALGGEFEEAFGVVGVGVDHHPVFEVGGEGDFLLDVFEEVAVLEPDFVGVDLDGEVVDAVAVDGEGLAEGDAALLLAETELDLLGVVVDAAHAGAGFQLCDFGQVLLELGVAGLVVQQARELAEFGHEVQVADLQLAAAVPALLLVDDQGLPLLLDDQVVARLVVLRERLLLVLELED
jgi:hypothetical protein